MLANEQNALALPVPYFPVWNVVAIVLRTGCRNFRTLGCDQLLIDHLGLKRFT